MAGTFKFELVSPERVLFSADADEVVVPGVEGDFTVYAGHAPVISALRPGFVDIATGGSKRRLFVKSGFADVNATSLTVLAETALDLAELDAARVADELKTAEAELENAKDDDQRTLAQIAIERLRSIAAKAA